MKNIIALLIVFSFSLFSQQTVIKGKLLGADGKPMLLAQVHLSKPFEKKSLADVTVGKDGSFSFITSEKDIVSLKCTGVNHTPAEVALFLDGKEKTIDLSVKLQTYKYYDDPTDVSIIGNLNKPDAETKTAVKQDDGIWKADFIANADTFAYEVKGITDRPVNGTQSDLFQYDGAGNYKSLIVGKEGQSISISVDPAKFFISKSEVKILVKGKKSLNAKFVEINLARQKRIMKFTEAYQVAKKSGVDMHTFHVGWSSDSAIITRQLAKEKQPLIRQLLLLSYGEMVQFGFRTVDITIKKSILKEIPPTSTLWLLNPTVIQVASADQEQFENFAQKVVEENPSRTLKSIVLLNQMQIAKFTGNTEKYKECYVKLTLEYGDTEFGQYAKDHFQLESKIAVGNTIPAFAVQSFDDSTKIISSDSLKGRVFMIDFWATWCGPCVGEMETLHKAYDRFKGKKGFEILSLSFDASPAEVVNFRKDKWKMPWLHSFVKEGFENELAKKFEVNGIPKPILVDETGKILAMEGDLRGPNLEKTLARFLGE